MTIEMCGSPAAWIGAAAEGVGGRFKAATGWPSLLLLPARDQPSRLDDVVLDRAVGPASVAADRPDAALAEDGREAVALGRRAARHVDVRGVHHDRVLG